MVIGLTIILMPLMLYLGAAFSLKKRSITSPDDFFAAYKKVGVTAFSSSSVAYNFQVSTIYPFLLWGISNIYLIPIVNTLCLGLGILLFWVCYPKFCQFIGKDVTLHGILGEKYGSALRVIASYMTIIAFLGFAISETYFGSKVMLALIDNKNLVYLIIVGTLLLVYCYIAYGGQLSSIRTDQLQLIISYIGIFGLMLYFLYLIISSNTNIPEILYYGLLALCIYIIFIFVLRRFRFIRLQEDDSFWNKFINTTLNCIVVAAFILLFAGAGEVFITRSPGNDLKSFFSLTNFGVCGLLSLIFLPLSFQFVDLSNWQRLLSVSGKDIADTAGIRKNIRRGLLTYSVESPFTWIIFIFFGLLATTALPHFSFKDLLIDIPKHLINSSDHFQAIFGYIFIISIISIMLSTIDSFLMSIIFTFVYDSYPKTRKWLDSGEEVKKRHTSEIIKIGKVFGLIAILTGALFFIIFDKSILNGGELFINLLLSFYAAQLGFLPHILGALFLKKYPKKGWAIASMLTGSLTGVGIGIYAVVAKPEWAWYPILICLSTSFSIYLLGYVVSNFDKEKMVVAFRFFVGKIFKNFWFRLFFLLAIITICFFHGCALTVRCYELTIFIILYFVFYLVYKNPNSRFHSYYEINTFYCDLMFFMTITIIVSNIHIFNQSQPDLDDAAKTWEVASYLVTLIYTWVFWRDRDKNGRKIIYEVERIKEDDGITPRASIHSQIIITLVLLSLIAGIHTSILFGHFIFSLLTGYADFQRGSFMYQLERFPSIFTIGLILVTYASFLYINYLVITYCKRRQYSRDFVIGLRYVDFPVFVIFCCLFIYSLCLTLSGNSDQMDRFFSGAIAFELLLSSICWANTGMFKLKKII